MIKSKEEIEQPDEAPPFKVGDRVSFAYWDSDECKDVTGRGRVTDVDLENDQLLVQTTRKLHWMQIDAAKLLPPAPTQQ